MSLQDWHFLTSKRIYMTQSEYSRVGTSVIFHRAVGAALFATMSQAELKLCMGNFWPPSSKSDRMSSLQGFNSCSIKPCLVIRHQSCLWVTNAEFEGADGFLLNLNMQKSAESFFKWYNQFSVGDFVGASSLVSLNFHSKLELSGNELRILVSCHVCSEFVRRTMECYLMLSVWVPMLSNPFPDIFLGTQKSHILFRGLHFNKFTGPIPASLGNLTFLKAL